MFKVSTVGQRDDGYEVLSGKLSSKTILTQIVGAIVSEFLRLAGLAGPLAQKRDAVICQWIAVFIHHSAGDDSGGLHLKQEIVHLLSRLNRQDRTLGCVAAEVDLVESSFLQQ